MPCVIITKIVVVWQLLQMNICENVGWDNNYMCEYKLKLSTISVNIPHRCWYFIIINLGQGHYGEVDTQIWSREYNHKNLKHPAR